METGLHITVTKIPYKFDVRSVRKKVIFIIVLILLCCLMLNTISSELKIYIDYYGHEIELNEMNGYINDYYDTLKNFDGDGVYIKTELDVYYVDTAGILVEWVNDTDLYIIDGYSWNLFKEQNGEFVPVVRESSSGEYYPGAIFSLNAGETGKRIYWLDVCTENNLTPGKYKIKTFFMAKKNPDDFFFSEYILETEFEVSDDESKCGKNSLNILNDNIKYSDITSGQYGTYGNYTYFRLYKNWETFDTFLTDGTYEYEIGAGLGDVGVLSNFEYVSNGRYYLVYSYSRYEDGEHRAYLCALDITDGSDIKEVHKSEPFVSEYDVMVSNFYTSDNNDIEGLKYGWLDENGELVVRENRGFAVSFVEWEKDEKTGHSKTKIVKTIGRLFCEDGVFFYEKGI